MVEVEYYTWDNLWNCKAFNMQYMKENNIERTVTRYDESKAMIKVEIHYGTDHENGSVGEDKQS